MTTCHNDLNPYNVICTEPHWVAIDWEFVGTNDPIFDVVALGAGLQRSAAACEQLTAQYLDGAATDRFTNNWRLFWLREYAWADHELRQGNELTEIAQQRATALDQLRDL